MNSCILCSSIRGYFCLLLFDKEYCWARTRNGAASEKGIWNSDWRGHKK